MLNAGRRSWRLFYLTLCVAVSVPLVAQGPALTTISDTVFRANGDPASGTLLISWPAFTTADNAAVAAGSLSVVLGTDGGFNAQLAPNAGATPAGTVYTVVYQLSDGTVRTERWSVGASSPETIAQVRMLPGNPGGQSQFATQQYVDSALANVVHLSGTETITGSKQFTVSPTVPAPAQPSHVANKFYVDAGNAGKADLVSGLVPTGELGTGSANSAACLHGDSSWGGCGTGSGSGLTPGMQAIKYATDFSWSQNPSADLSAPGEKTVTLAPCPAGVSGSEPEYYVYVSGTGTAEAVLVTGGTCAGNGLGGTLQFTTANPHPGGYSVGSASGGLQEALIAARFTPSNPAGSSQSGKVIVPPGELKAFARISIRASNITVDFSGSIVECWMNDSCLYVGDGLTSRFHLSQTPFTRFNRTIFNEEYAAATLDQTRWQTIDPGAHSSVSAGKLQIAGGDGSDGTTTVSFVEKLELGGATVLQHGDVVFNAASSGILGGLYLGNVLSANCIAGFQISASGSASQIQALINGTLTGAPLTATADHHYVLTTRIYSQEIYRLQQIFHSAANPAGSGLGGTQVSANARLVLEVHDIDPANPGTMVAPSTVLYDGVIFGAPAFCTYALVNSPSLFCSIAFTRMIEAADTQVRSALPGQPFRTRLVGPLSSGGECNIYSGNVLDFFSSYVPALNEQIEVRYRGRGRAMARVTNPASITAESRGSDDGVRGVVRHIKIPAARTSSDCESAALALLSDQAGPGWTGEYKTWNDFLPGNATDIFPGDALNVNIPTRGAVFQAIVNEVEVFCEHPADDHSVYKIIFADAAARNPAFESENAKSSSSLKIAPVTNTQIGTTTLAELTNAAITAADATTASIDTGIPALIGGGFEVRWSDTGWGPYNDQNLAGRFTTQTFTLPRLARVQDYYLRQFDGSTPTKYSRYSAALHLDRPLT